MSRTDVKKSYEFLSIWTLWHLFPQTFSGNRPSLSLLLPELSAYNVGQVCPSLKVFEMRGSLGIYKKPDISVLCYIFSVAGNLWTQSGGSRLCVGYQFVWPVGSWARKSSGYSGEETASFFPYSRSCSRGVQLQYHNTFETLSRGNNSRILSCRYWFFYTIWLMLYISQILYQTSPEPKMWSCFRRTSFSPFNQTCNFQRFWSVVLFFLLFYFPKKLYYDCYSYVILI